MLRSLSIPADVPPSAHQAYLAHYATVTKNTGNLFLFAADQKMEHLNADFYGNGIHPDAHAPEHLFKIASQGSIGAFATHLGLIARYGRLYPKIPYIAKLNGKTDCVRQEHDDPMSEQLWSVDDVLTLKKHAQLSICGVGYTIYLGSRYESRMLAQAAQLIYQAHAHGLITVLWVYARGKSITDDQAPALLAGATGVAACLGSDFVKIKAPTTPDALLPLLAAAGTTKVICSGGGSVPPQQFLQQLEVQLQAGCAGSATGRNIFQKSLPEALAFTQALNAMIIDGTSAAQALQLYQDMLRR